MQEFSEITIKDKQLFESYLMAGSFQASEMTFTNLFMWRDFYRLRYAVLEDLLCIISARSEAHPFAFMPAGKLDNERFLAAFKKLREYFNERGWKLRFSRIDQDQLSYFQNLPMRTSIKQDPANSDYVYLASDLINLKGKKFDGKRNHINKFKKLYTYEYVPVTQGLIGHCERIMEEWCHVHDCDCVEGGYCERFANQELLDNFEKLGCKGALIKVDGKFQAFTIGEMLNSDTAVIHIEKASSNVQGLYTFINQQFCENEWSNATYINREQDLGLEGLRKAKLSYNPVKMIQKHIVKIEDFL